MSFVIYTGRIIKKDVTQNMLYNTTTPDLSSNILICLFTRMEHICIFIINIIYKIMSIALDTLIASY